MKTRSIWLLFLLIVTVVYAPTMWAEPCIVDDGDLFGWLHNAKGHTFSSIFFPGGDGGGYYRPLLALSFVLDLFIWNSDLKFMHFENILLHSVNALLVMKIAARQEGQETVPSWLPFIAGLLFALHPIATESVSWLSGRPDLLSGMFILLSTLMVLEYRSSRRGLVMIGALLMFLLAMLAKESALGFFFGLLVILSARKSPQLLTSSQKKIEIRAVLVIGSACALGVLIFYSYWPAVAGCVVLSCILAFIRSNRKLQLRNIMRSMTAIGAVSAAICSTFVLLRKLAFASDSPKIAQTLKLFYNELNYTVLMIMGGVGYYLKKFYFPLPLNFAIRDIDPLYQVLGVLVILALVWIAFHQTIDSAFIITGVFLFLPALLLVLGTIAWTAYAERYIYMSSAFWTIATLRFLSRRNVCQTYIKPATVVLVVVTAMTVSHRSYQWMTNYRLLADTVEKSPKFRLIRTEYVELLIQQRKYAEARRHLDVARTLPGVGYDATLDVCEARLLVGEGNSAEATKVYQRILEKTKWKNLQICSLYADHLAAVLPTLPEGVARKEAAAALYEVLQYVYGETGESFLSYRLGKVSHMLGNVADAACWYDTAYQKLPAESSYRLAAAKMAAKLRGQI